MVQYSVLFPFALEKSYDLRQHVIAKYMMSLR
jgi:hypothetical protein